MARPLTRKIVNALALVVGGVCACAMALATIFTAFPALAFAHQAGDHRIMFHATDPLPQDAAIRAAATAWADMQDTPFGQPDHQIHVFLAEGGWRNWLFFRGAPGAGGLTYPAFWQDRMFLSGADLEAGLLLNDGAPVPPPRDLTYYLVHEMTHLRHAEVLGGFAMFRAAFWVREGVADIAALGPAHGEMIARAMAGEGLPRAAYGSYPLERVCATMVLAQPGMTMDRFLTIRADMHLPTTCATLPRPDSD
ncbi:hypothetical protein [Hasllibacter sp. MH4015]|uniref:hypothetical protein n=1 Tax=Hasllibacter sp. MH4015 TaxID=2854029 RepID=UPI001CD30B17|nr:hypothetical protein [Hasllibacter sp. MH4015]